MKAPWKAPQIKKITADEAAANLMKKAYKKTSNKLTNLDIWRDYQDFECHVHFDEFLAAYAYWYVLTQKQPNVFQLFASTYDLKKRLLKFYDDSYQLEVFDHKRLQLVINQNVLARFQLHFDDVETLADGMLYMILRNHITQ